MSIHFASPAPVLVINIKTGEFVMTQNVTRITKCYHTDEHVDFEPKSRVYVRQDISAGSNCFSQHCYELSPYTPKELRASLFDMGGDDGELY